MREYNYYINEVKKFFKEAFTQNIPLKIIAFIITVVIFIFVHGGENTKIKLMIDVELLLPPKSSKKVIVSDFPEQIKLTLQGPKSIINTLKKEEISPLRIDVRDGESRIIYFEDLEYHLPLGVKLVSVVPSTAKIVFEDEITREIPVKVDFCLLYTSPSPRDS